MSDPAKELVEGHRKLMEEVLRGIAAHTKRPQIPLATPSDSNFGAKIGPAPFVDELITITEGTFLLLGQMFMSLVIWAENFPELPGGYTEADLPDHLKFNPNDGAQRVQIPGLPVERIEVARLMHHLSLRFLLSHEVGHAEAGHLAFGRAALGIESLSELRGATRSSTREDPLTSQALEMDADCYAIRQAIFALHGTAIHQPGSWAPFISDPSKAMRYLGFAVYCFFRLLHDLDAGIADDPNERTHPRPLLRYVICGATLATVLEGHGYESWRPHFDAFVQAFADAERAYCRIAGQEPARESMQTALRDFNKMEPGNRAYELQMRWEQLIPLLQPHSRVNLLTTKYQRTEPKNEAKAGPGSG